MHGKDRERVFDQTAPQTVSECHKVNHKCLISEKKPVIIINQIESSVWK